MSDEKIEEKPVEVTLPAEDEVQVELGDNTKVKEPEARVAVKADAPTAQEDAREKALADMKRQYEHQKRVAEAERQARKQAEDFARQQAQQAQYSRGEVQDSNLKIIMNAIDATEQAAANAERDYAEAMQAGNYQLAAEAQRAMARCESHILQLQNGKQRIEESLQQQTAEGSVYEQQMPNFEPQVPQDPVEMFASKLAPKSAQWLRSHPDAVNKIQKLRRAHEDAVEDGYAAESPEYFRYIEGRLGYGEEQPREQPREEQPRQQAAPRKQIASAPVSSAASVSSRSSQPNTMTLSSAEVEMAILAEPELPRDKAIESYARNKAFLIKQGKLSA
jgi:hypothetical protein